MLSQELAAFLKMGAFLSFQTFQMKAHMQSFARIKLSPLDWSQKLQEEEKSTILVVSQLEIPNFLEIQLQVFICMDRTLEGEKCAAHKMHGRSQLIFVMPKYPLFLNGFGMPSKHKLKVC